MYVWLLVSALAVLCDSTSALSLIPPATECGPNEILTDCYNECQLTCKNRIKGYDNFCTDECGKSGCVCKPEFYRHDNGSCVLQENCSPPHCNDDEVYNVCGTSCMDTCEMRGDTCQDCQFHCIEGCFCPEGHYRATNGTCISAEQCPPRTCDGDNEYFDECPPICLDSLDESCATVGIAIVNCTQTLDCCQPQCRCKPDHYRNSEGFCIPAAECFLDLEDYVPADEPESDIQEEPVYQDQQATDDYQDEID